MKRYKSGKIKIYKPFFNRWEYWLLEMSQTRQVAENKIRNYILPLLIHLIAIEEFGKKDQNYDKWLKEIKNLRNIIIKANQKKKTNKTWFSMQFIVDLSEYEMPTAIYRFWKKYDKEVSKDYQSILDFEWFDLYK